MTEATEFLTDLKALLEKHNATIRAEHLKHDMLIYATLLKDGRDVFIAEENDTKYMTIGIEDIEI